MSPVYLSFIQFCILLLTVHFRLKADGREN